MLVRPAISATLIAAFCACVVGQEAVAPPTPLDFAAVSGSILDATNALRKKQTLDAVRRNAKLDAAADMLARFMAAQDRFDHAADGRQPWERATAASYEGCTVTENIAYVFNTTPASADDLAQRFVDNWEQSPEHLRNMLDVDVVELGVAVSQIPESGKLFAVQVFGRPRSMMARFTIRNKTSRAIQYYVAGQVVPLEPDSGMIHERCTGQPTKVSVPTGNPAVFAAETLANDGEVWAIRDTVGGSLEFVRVEP